jgi:hypothetical protein
MYTESATLGHQMQFIPRRDVDVVSSKCRLTNRSGRLYWNQGGV